MGLFDRIFDTRARQAREAEAKGDLRRAATLWLEAGQGEKAAELLARAGDQGSPTERLALYEEALGAAPQESAALRRRLEGALGAAMLEGARAAGATGAAARRTFAEAASKLERAERWSEAADCHELLGDTDALARCLEQGGEIERLERVLDRSHAKDERAERLRRLVDEQEMALRVGARILGRAALREASALAPGDAALAEALRRLEERWPRGGRLRIDVDGRRVTLVGTLPATLGRSEAEIVVRGGSVSRAHAALDRRGERLVVRDLGSRNGTLVAGVPIAGELELSGPTEIGLGDDVLLKVSPASALGEHVEVEVLRGLDRGERAVAGQGALRVPGLGASFRLATDRAVLVPDPGIDLRLGAQGVAAEIELLVGDVLAVGGVRVEVLP